MCQLKENANHDDRLQVIDWSRFVRRIVGSQRIALTTHVRPDCDAVGSQLAMALILETLGKQVLPVNAFDLPANLTFLDPHKRLKRLGRDATAADVQRCDLLVILDTTAWAQLGEMAEVIRTTKVPKAVLDHHVSGDDLGAELFKDTASEATGRLVVEAADRLGVPLTPEMATPLFAAIATDTGWFRFASTNSETFALAARLIRAGARADALYRQLYENDTVARLNLIGRVMARAVTEQGGRLIHTYILREDLNQTGAVASDSEDIINMTLTVGGTEVAVILIEQPSGAFKISFRSRCAVDCSRLAELFGGGGHKAAAGALVNGPLAAAQARVLGAVRAAMQQSPIPAHDAST